MIKSLVTYMTKDTWMQRTVDRAVALNILSHNLKRSRTN